MVEFPLDPPLSKMLIIAESLGVDYAALINLVILVLILLRFF